jgi:hypothetical protein
MPMEGQWDRALTPLRPRDKRLIAIVGVIATAALIVALVFALTRPPHRQNLDCVVINISSTMGGGPVSYCGRLAKTFCHTKPVPDPAVDQCDRLGYVS